ncbi:hypothetical protein [Streptomyces subrutilus]|uniref:Uncharacterized protein n=1 Tax=Streptomyces subrutilus TaxID=36818 RepID=A0A1E5PL61_9ACTN|nr:hypothetical protein [Streptomyces subrutilus]OEJ30306.1 hypothetical protein BGK67_02100 [Streptomyces subrutilus]
MDSDDANALAVLWWCIRLGAGLRLRRVMAETEWRILSTVFTKSLVTQITLAVGIVRFAWIGVSIVIRI